MLNFNTSTQKIDILKKIWDRASLYSPVWPSIPGQPQQCWDCRCTTSGNCAHFPPFLSETGSHVAQDGSNYDPTPLTPAPYRLGTGFLATLLWSPALSHCLWSSPEGHFQLLKAILSLTFFNSPWVWQGQEQMLAAYINTRCWFNTCGGCCASGSPKSVLPCWSQEASARVRSKVAGHRFCILSKALPPIVPPKSQNTTRKQQNDTALRYQ